MKSSVVMMMKTASTEALVHYLSQSTPPLINPDTEALCSLSKIMLDYNYGIPPDMEALTVIPKSQLVSKTVEFENMAIFISALPDVDLAHILKYIRFVSSLLSSLLFSFFFFFFFIALCLFLSFFSFSFSF